MILDIDSIIRNNILLGIEQGFTLEEATKVLKAPYFISVNRKNAIEIIIIDNVEFYFISKIFKFGIVKIWSGSEVIYMDNKINEETTLETFRNILSLSNIPYSESEFLKNNQLDLELENGVIFSFQYFESIYFLAKIEWGGKP